MCDVRGTLALLPTLSSEIRLQRTAAGECKINVERLDLVWELARLTREQARSPLQDVH